MLVLQPGQNRPACIVLRSGRSIVVRPKKGADNGKHHEQQQNFDEIHKNIPGAWGVQTRTKYAR
jgi:hypothetical protein